MLNSRRWWLLLLLHDCERLIPQLGLQSLQAFPVLDLVKVEHPGEAVILEFVVGELRVFMDLELVVGQVFSSSQICQPHLRIFDVWPLERIGLVLIKVVTQKLLQLVLKATNLLFLLVNELQVLLDLFVQPVDGFLHLSPHSLLALGALILVALLAAGKALQLVLLHALLWHKVFANEVHQFFKHAIGSLYNTIKKV